MENIVQKKDNRLVYALAVIGFFGIFSTTISKNPVLPLFVHELGGNEEIIGLISAISPLAGIIFSFPVGFFIDRIGRKTLLLISAFFFVAAPLSYVFIFNPFWLIPIRFLHGVATAILNPLANTIVFHNYPESKGEKLGFYSSATLFGRTLAPFLGGLIIAAFAGWGGLWSYRLVYAAAFLLALPVVFLALSIKLQEENVELPDNNEPRLRAMLGALKNFIRHSRLFSTAVLEMSIYFSFGVLETFLPIYLHKNNYGGPAIGLIFSLQILSIALTKPFFGKIADRRDKRLLIVAGMAIIGFCMAGLPLFSNYIILVFLSLMFGVGMSLATVSTNSYVGDIVEKKDLGSSMGALSSIMDIGHSFGPLLTGAIIFYSSLTFGFLFSLLVSLGAVLFFSISNFAYYNKVN